MDVARLEELLVFYFTGELDRLIKRLRVKVQEKWPDYYYYPVYGVDYDHVIPGYIGGHSDPTGNRATKLADLRLEREKELNNYIQLKQVFNERIGQFKDDDVLILKAYLGVGDGMHETADKIGSYFGGLKQRAKDLMNILKFSSKDLLLEEEVTDPRVLKLKSHLHYCRRPISDVN